MDPRGEVSSVNCLRFERLLPGSPESVWRHLTQTDLLPAWFGKTGHIEPHRGGKVTLMDGHIRGTVTQWHPPSRLVYTWNVFEPGAPEDAVSDYPESYLTFELEARNDGVLMRFQHFPIPERFLPQTAMGWHTMLDMTEAALRGEALLDRSAYVGRNAELYGVDLENLER